MIMKYHELVHNLQRWLRFFWISGPLSRSRWHCKLQAATGCGHGIPSSQGLRQGEDFPPRFIGVGGIHMLATCWTTSWKLIQPFGFQSFWCNTRTSPSRTEANGGSSGVLFERGWRITPKRVNDEVSLNHGVCVDWSFCWLRWRCWYRGGVMSLKVVLIKFQQTIVYTTSGSFEAVKHVQAKFHIWISPLILRVRLLCYVFLLRPSDSWNLMALDNGDFERGSQAFMFSD